VAVERRQDDAQISEALAFRVEGKPARLRPRAVRSDDDFSNQKIAEVSLEQRRHLAHRRSARYASENLRRLTPQLFNFGQRHGMRQA
jgi:hypothetical protein